MEQHKFSEEEIKNVSHTFAIQKASAIGVNLSRKRVKEYISEYIEVKKMFEKYNDTGELPKD